MPTIGDLLAERYRLDALIGRGGFASVFRARDLRLGRDVAVKVLREDLASDPVIAERFDREARALAAVSHPNVVAIHDVSPGDPAIAEPPFLVMDLCEGGSLADRLATSATGTLEPDVLIPILVDVAAGLDALHEQGIVHRDVKPSNVLLSDGRARIGDLGIATHGPSELTATGATLGTLSYLAPEQLSGEPGSPASDVYGIGAIGFLALTGRLPRPGGSVSEVVAASVLPVEPVSALRPELGGAFDSAIGRALVPDPADRPSAAAIGAMLTVALEVWSANAPSMAAAAPSGLASAGVPVGAVAGPGIESAPTEVVSVGVASDDGPGFGEGGAAGAAGAGAAAPAAVAAPNTAQTGGAAPATALTAASMPAAASPVATGRAPRGADGRLIGAGALVAAFVLVVGALLLFGRGGRGPAGASGAAVAGASARPAASATARETAGASAPAATRPAAAPVDPYRAAEAARDDLRTAVAAANLKDKDARELTNSIDRIDKALAKHDAKPIRNEAKKLADRVAKLIDQGSVDGKTATRLSGAADALLDAANALPA